MDFQVGARRDLLLGFSHLLLGELLYSISRLNECLTNRLDCRFALLDDDGCEGEGNQQQARAARWKCESTVHGNRYSVPGFEVSVAIAGWVFPCLAASVNQVRINKIVATVMHESATLKTGNRIARK